MRHALPALLLLLLPAACSGRTELVTSHSGNSPDAAGNSGSDAGTDGRGSLDGAAPWRCPSVAGTCERQYPVLLEASTLGTDVRFVALARSFVFAERRVDGKVEPLIIDADQQLPAPRILSFGVPPSSTLRPVALTVGGDHVVALLRDGQRYDLFATRRFGGSTLERIAGGGIDWQGELLGVGFNQNETGALESVCVFGDGLACFENGTWNVREASGTRPWLRAAASGYTLLLVGDAGRILETRFDSAWRTLDSGTTASLRAVALASNEDRATAVGDSGTIVELSLPSGSASVCSVGAADNLALATDFDSRLRRIEAFSGTGFVSGDPNDTAPWCAGLLEPHITASGDFCGVAFNVRVLSSSQLRGDNYCFVD